MSTKNTYIKITPDGKCHMVEEIVSERDVKADLITSLCQDAEIITRRAFRAPNGNPCTIIATREKDICFTDLKSIRLNASFKVDNNKLVHPYFLKTEENLASMQLEWPVPSSMRLLFISKIACRESGCASHADQHNWLMALDAGKRFWRLPLPNLFDDCAICMGHFNGQSQTMQESLALALDQFDKSSWNADLSSERQQELSKAMFSFKSVDGDKFEVVHVENWQSCCDKVSTSISNLILRAIQ